MHPIPIRRDRRQDTTKKTLRDVLGYRLYCDLRRGWRITNPNLERQLLEIVYQSLDECSEDEEEWSSNTHTAGAATPRDPSQIAP